MRKSGEGVEDFLSGLQDTVSRLLFYAGGIGLLGGIGFLLYYFFSFAGAQPTDVAKATQMVDMFGRVAAISGLIMAIGAAIVFWGEEVLSVLLIIVTIAIVMAPVFLPQFVGGSVEQVAATALQRVQTAGFAIGIVTVIVTLFDVITRVRDRAKEGSKADSLKYGKGVREEDDRQNVFMGKCWQLPYCRKFVREKCPIYHTRRTCWKERVGCMCEEKVIQNAMEGKPIPKDAIAAAKFIPYNTSLPMEIKIKRCQQCVIYNEHQKHKYKLLLPLTLLLVLSIYLVGRDAIKAGVGGILSFADKFLGQATLTGKPNIAQNDQLPIMQEVLSVLLMIMVLAYLLKMLEYMIFKLKM